MLNHWARCALVLLPSIALAAPIDDVRNGTNLFLNGVTVKVDGEFASTGGWEIPKLAGTLDVDLTLSNFGIASSQPIHATGTASSDGQTIVWTFDKTFSPRVRVDSSTEVQRAHGSLAVKVGSLTPEEVAQCAASHCERNVRLSALISNIYVSGEGELGIDFNELVDVRSFKMLGGIGRPVLTGFAATGQMSKKGHEQDLPITVWLDRPAPTGGATVALWSASSDAIFSASSMVIPGGASSGIASLKIPAWFTGTFNIRGTSGGASVLSRVTIATEPDQRRNPFDVAEWVPDALAGCSMCSGFIERAGDDVSISMIRGIPSIVEKTRIRDMRTVLSATAVNPVALTSTGWSAGTLTNSQGTFAFVANVTNTLVPRRLYRDLAPVSVAPNGVLLGNRTTGVSSAGFATHGSFSPLAMPSGTRSSNATAMSARGDVTGTLVDASGTFGFRWLRGATTKIHRVAPNTTFTPVAINANGEVTGFVTDRGGNRSAMRVSADNSSQTLGKLSGATSMWPTSQNDLGWVVGTAKRAGSTVGFLWTTSTGLIELSRMAPSPRFVVLEALSVTNDKKIVVRANNSGRVDLYLLSL